MYQQPPLEPVVNLIPRNGNQGKIFGIGVCMICSVLSIIAILIVLALIPLYIPNRSTEIAQSTNDIDEELMLLEIGTDFEYAETRVNVPIDQETFSKSLEQTFGLDAGTLNVTACEFVENYSTNESSTRRRRQFKRDTFKNLFKVAILLITKPPCLAKYTCNISPKQKAAQKAAAKEAALKKIQTLIIRTFNIPTKNGRVLSFTGILEFFTRYYVPTKAPVTTVRTTSATTKIASSATTKSASSTTANPTTVIAGVTSSSNIQSTAAKTSTVSTTTVAPRATTVSTAIPVVPITKASTTTSTSITTSTSTTASTSTTTIVLYNLTQTNEIVYGIWNTIVGGDSSAATAGTLSGNYPSTETPSKIFDGQLTTKYTTFGNCSASATPSIDCGKNAGFYLTLNRGSSLLQGFRICAAASLPARDPLTLTIEGSNQASTALTLGSSWTLIYNGVTGLATDPGRGTCGPYQYFSNSVSYSSYRLLITSKRGSANAIQYAEVQLLGT